MFQSICLRNLYGDNGSPDLGLLAEAMLFYKTVHLIAHFDTLELLLRTCGPELLFEYIDEGFLTIHYVGSTSSIKILNPGTTKEMYQPQALRVLEFWQIQEAAPIIFQNVLGISARSKKLGNEFAGRVHSIVPKKDVMETLRDDFSNKSYSKNAIKQLLPLLAPDYQLPKRFQFNVSSTGDIKDLHTFLAIKTNLDFVLSNNFFHLRTKSGLKPISPALLLNLLFDARMDLYFASLCESEIATTSLLSAVIKAKCQDLLSTRIRNKTHAEIFQDKFLYSSHAIREAINSGERDYKDLIKLLRSGQKWRSWLHKQDSDANLIEEYYKELTNSTCFETLPIKILRWTILTALGISLIQTPPVVSLGIPAALSVFDTFLLEKLVSGWKPNQFVEGPLSNFIPHH